MGKEKITESHPGKFIAKIFLFKRIIVFDSDLMSLRLFINISPTFCYGFQLCREHQEDRKPRQPIILWNQQFVYKAYRFQKKIITHTTNIYCINRTRSRSQMSRTSSLLPGCVITENFNVSSNYSEAFLSSHPKGNAPINANYLHNYLH